MNGSRNALKTAACLLGMLAAAQVAAQQYCVRDVTRPGQRDCDLGSHVIRPASVPAPFAELAAPESAPRPSPHPYPPPPRASVQDGAVVAAAGLLILTAILTRGMLHSAMRFDGGQISRLRLR